MLKCVRRLNDFDNIIRYCYADDFYAWIVYFFPFDDSLSLSLSRDSSWKKAMRKIDYVATKKSLHLLLCKRSPYSTWIDGDFSDGFWVFTIFNDK